MANFRVRAFTPSEVTTVFVEAATAVDAVSAADLSSLNTTWQRAIVYDVDTAEEVEVFPNDVNVASDWRENAAPDAETSAAAWTGDE